MKDKNLTAILSLFTGVWGVHRFYLGDVGLGFLYFFTAGFCGIMPIVDFVAFLIMPKDQFDARYNKAAYISSPSSSPSNLYIADEISKLDRLFRDGVITFEEFERRKSALMNN